MRFTFAKENKVFIFEKFFTFSLLLLMLFKLSPDQVLTAFIILGQAHFILAYLYQIKAGKATFRNIALFSLCMPIFYIAAVTYPMQFLILTAAWGVFHINISEVRFQKRKMNPGYFCLMVAIMLISSCWIANNFPNVHIPVDRVCYLTLLAGIPAGIWYFVKAKKPLSIEAYAVFLVIVLLVYIGIGLSGVQPSAAKVFAIPNIMHYITFYAATARRFYREDKEKMFLFLSEVTFINLCMAAGYFALMWGLWSNKTLYTFWYAPTAFYAWSFMHAAATFKPRDYAGSLNLRFLDSSGVSKV